MDPVMEGNTGPTHRYEIWVRVPDGPAGLQVGGSIPRPRGRNWLRDVPRRILDALPGRRTRSHSNASTSSSSEPSTPSLPPAEQTATLPPDHPYLAGILPQPTAPRHVDPIAHPELPPGWPYSVAPLLQMPIPQIPGMNDPPTLPMQMQMQTQRRKRSYIPKSSAPGRERIERANQCFPNGTEHPAMTQFPNIDQRTHDQEDTAYIPPPVSETGGHEHGHRTVRATPGPSSQMGDSRPSVPKRPSTIYSFPTVSTEPVPKRQSVDSRPSSFYPPMPSHFSANTSVLEALDGQRSPSHSLDDAVSTFEIDDVQSSGGLKRRSRDERSQLGVSFSSEISERAPSTVPTASTDGTSRSMLERPAQSSTHLTISEDERTMILEHRLRRELSKVLGIPDDIARLDPQAANVRVLKAVHRLKFEKRKAEEAVRRLEHIKDGIRALIG